VSGVSNVVIRIGAETASAVSSIKNVDRALGETQTSGQKMHSAITSAAIPAAAALTALTAAGISSAKAAAEDQASRQLLDSQLKRSLGATEDVTKANEDWIDSMSRTVAVADDELRPALAGAVRATGDLHQAQQLLKTALDVSAATGKPLGSVVTALGKAYNGSASSLKRLVPSLSDAAIKSGDYARIQAELNKQVGGAAKGQAQTAAGQYKAMGIAIHELQESIGMALLPVLQELIPVMTHVVGLFQGHSGVIVAVAGAVGVFAVAILAANAALGAYATIQSVAAVAQDLLNSSMVRSAVIIARNTVLTVVYGARQIAVAAATKAWAIAQWLLNAAMSANPIGLAIIAVAALTAAIVIAYKHSATFRAIVQSAFSVARQNAVLLLGPLGLIIRAFQLLYQNSGTVRQAVSSAMDAIRRAIQLVLEAVNQLVGAISHIHFPSKPSWVPFSVPAVSSSATGRAATSSGPVVNVSISGAIDPEATALAIRRVLTRYDRRRGRSPLGGAGGGLVA
jgi:hypothetical protein